MTIKQHISPNITKGRSNYKPDIIVCHITEGGYDGAVSWLCNPQSQVSTHFVVAKDGRVAQLVDLQNTAWGNGTTTISADSRYYGHSSIAKVRERKTTANFYTVSIEHEGFYKDGKGSLTDKQLEAAAELVAYIRAEIKRIYGIVIPLDKEHIVGHCHIAPKWKPNCPGEEYPFDTLIKKAATYDKLTLEPVAAQDKTKQIMPEPSVVIYNGKEIEITRIFKDDTNYIKLRDLEKMGMSVGYDEKLKLVSINSNE